MQQTKAEIRARAMAKRLEEAGFDVKVTVERRDAEYYSHGGVMMPESVIVSVSARGPNSWDYSFSFTFLSWLPAKGHRASTCFIGGHLYRGIYSSRKPSRKLSLKELRLCIGTEVSNARYAKSQEV